MTMNEFKAWLDGYSASFTDDTPNPAQWAEIKKRMDRVAPAPLIPDNIGFPGRRVDKWSDRWAGDDVSSSGRWVGHPAVPYTTC